MYLKTIGTDISFLILLLFFDINSILIKRGVSKTMKTALVLAGGGAKGAYEAGCIKALEELKQHYEIVTGTSIGALNGLLIAQQDLEALYTLWNTITIKDVLKDPINFNFSMDSLISQANLIKPFFKSYIDEKGADISPLIAMLHRLYHEEKVFNSPIDYGIVTVKYPLLSPLEITKKDMKAGEPLQYAIASASCFPAFPVHYIGEQGYIDGGYFDNLPISLALTMGAHRIIAIELGTEATHTYFQHRPNITLLRPSQDLGGFLDFSREILDFRIQLGYFDTLKTFGELKGFKYTFEFDEIDAKQQFFFYQLVLKYENSVNRSHSIVGDTPITKKLLEMTYKHALNLEDYLLLGLETAMKVHDYSYLEVYHYQEVSKEIYQRFINGYQNSTVHERGFSLKKYTEIFKDFTTKEIIFYLYHDLVNNDKIDVSTLGNLFIEELTIALYFYTLKQYY